MAAVAGQETVTIVVNERELVVPKGELIVESVKRLGLEIPIFCYHPRMTPVGMCRMCLVEVGFRQPDGSVRKMPKPQTACTLPASEGLVIYTDTEVVHRDRKGVLEFLLINHPLDCPICDRGGECPLQNNTLFYGPSTSRFIEVKRHLPKAFPLSRHVVLDLERCIQCGRCVRFTEEISGDSQLAFRFRGAQMQPSTFQLTDFESKFSGNTIEICPVGALTSAQYRFRARPWDLETKPAICTVCSNGCNVWFDYRAGKLVRINGRTNEAVNEEWTCDRGKFGHEFYNAPNRLTRPLIRRVDRLEPCSWAEAYEAIARVFASGRGKVAGLAGPMLSNEAYYLFQRLFREAFKSPHLDHRPETRLVPFEHRPENRFGLSPIGFTIAGIEAHRSILVFGSSLADEAPIVYLRVRKTWFRHAAKVVVAHDRPSETESFADSILRYALGSEGMAALGLLKAAEEQGLDGLAPVARVDWEAIEARTGLDRAAFARAADTLRADPPVILCTHELLDRPRGHLAAELLAVLAHRLGGEFGLLSLGANEEGARWLGVLPDTLPGGAPVPVGDSGSSAEGRDPASGPGLDTRGILEGCARGEVEALWLAGCDPFTLAPHNQVERALEEVPFLVFMDIKESPALAYASVVLPMAAPAEQDGTYTNVEGRVQRLRQIIPPPGEAKPAWRIFSEAELRVTPRTPFFNPGEIMDEIASKVPAFAPARYSNLDGEGVRLQVEPGVPDLDRLGDVIASLEKASG